MFSRSPPKPYPNPNIYIISLLLPLFRPSSDPSLFSLLLSILLSLLPLPLPLSSYPSCSQTPDLTGPCQVTPWTMSPPIWNPPPELKYTRSQEPSQRPPVPIADDDGGNHPNHPDEFHFCDLEASPTPGLLNLTTRSRRISPAYQACTCGWLSRFVFRRTAHACHQWARLVVIVISFLLAFTALFNPSYTRGQYPENYHAVTDSVRRGGGTNPAGFWRGDAARNTKTTTGGRGNPLGEKVYIAANIVDAELVRGAWGDAVLELMDLLGEQNVFLSEFVAAVPGGSIPVLTEQRRHLRERFWTLHPRRPRGSRRSR